MKKLLLAPAFLFAACASDSVPDVDQPVSGTANDSDTTPAQPSESENALSASFVAAPAACDSNEVSFEAASIYADGTVVSNPVCHYDFGDGTFGDSCSARHSYSLGFGNYVPSANVTLTVTDPASGATATYSDLVLPPGNFDAYLNASSDGLTISYEGHAYYVDADYGIGPVTIEPADKVIDVPSAGKGTVRVTEPGTYVVKAYAAIFPGVENCEANLEQTVIVSDPCDLNGDGDTTDHGECNHVCHDGE
jgi:hypothetical protein